MKKAVVASVIVGLGIAVGGFFPGYYYYKTLHDNRSVTVKGLAEMNVKADLAIWKIKFKTTGNDLSALQQKMTNDLRIINNYLAKQGFNGDEVIVGRINTNDLMANQYRDARASESRYILDQTITVHSTQVDKVEQTLREIGELVAQGVIFEYQDYGSPVTYISPDLNRLSRRCWKKPLAMLMLQLLNLLKALTVK